MHKNCTKRVQFLCYVRLSNTNSRTSIFFETSNGRLPLERSSHCCQTSPKRVWDDSRHFMFRRPKKMFFRIFSVSESVFRHFCCVLVDLSKNGRHEQLLRHFWLQIDLFVARYDPWSSSWNRVPSWDGLCERHWPVPRGAQTFIWGGGGHLPANTKW